MLSAAERQMLPDLIAKAIREEINDKSYLTDGGSIIVEIGHISKDGNMGLQNPLIFPYAVRSNQDTIIYSDGSDCVSDSSVVAQMMISNAIQAYQHDGKTLLSGINPTIAKYSTSNGFINCPGGILIVVQDSHSTEIVGWAVFGGIGAEREAALSAAKAIGIVKKALAKNTATIIAPKCLDIKDALLAYDIANACKNRGRQRPLIIGNIRAMYWDEHSILSQTLRAAGVSPVSINSPMHRKQAELIRSFICMHRDPKDFNDIYNLVRYAELKNEHGQLKDCVVVVGNEDLKNVLSAYVHKDHMTNIYFVE